MQGRVQQLYAVQCPGTVSQSDVADGQCAALPRDCTQATRSLEETFTAMGQPTTTTTVAPTRTVKKLYPISDNLHAYN